ncbi:MAG: hypothetical protein ABIJ16_10935 [Bacteroidota bacterium]
MLRTDHFELKESTEYYIDSYSMLDKSFVESFTVGIPASLNNDMYFEELFFVENKWILFTTATCNSGQNTILYVQYLDNRGQVKNKPKKIAEIPKENTPDDWFRIIRTGNKILIEYNRSYLSYNGIPFHIKIINSNLEVTDKWDFVFEKMVDNPHFRIKKILMGESGNIYFLTRADLAVKKKKRSPVIKQENIIFVYNQEQGELYDFKIALKKYVPEDVTFALNADEEIVVFGFMTPKNRNNLEGIFYQVIDPRTRKEKFPVTSKYNYMVFSKEQEAEFKSKRSMKAKGNVYEYIPKDIIFIKNGCSLFISEQQYRITEKFTDPKTGRDNIIENYYAGDLILSMGDKDGKISWVRRVYKDQQSIDDDMYYLSYAAINGGNNVKLLYNDNSSNLKKELPDKYHRIKFVPGKTVKGMAVLASVFKDGRPMKDPAFGHDSKNVVFLPRLIKRTADERFIICARQKNRIRFGTMYFE